jgi:hypothetical protein
MAKGLSLAVNTLQHKKLPMQGALIEFCLSANFKKPTSKLNACHSNITDTKKPGKPGLLH